MCKRGIRFCCALLLLFCFLQSVVYADTSAADMSTEQIIAELLLHLNERESKLLLREQVLNTRERRLDERTADYALREQSLTERETALQTRELSMTEIENSLRSLQSESRRRLLVAIGEAILLAGVTAIAIWR